MTTERATRDHSEPAPRTTQQQELRLFPPTSFHALTRNVLWTELIIAGLLLASTGLNASVLIASAILIAGLAIWGNVISHEPERYVRGFLLYVAYAGAVASLAFLAMSLADATDGKFTIVVLYALGSTAMALFAPWSVNRERDRLSGKARKWLSGSRASGMITGAAALGAITSQLLKDFAGYRTTHVAYATLALVAAVLFTLLCCHNLEKYRRYPAVMRRAHADSQGDQKV